MPEPIKISVLADGSLLLHDQPAPLAQITEAVAAAPDDAVVWYYREAATGEPPPDALAVIKAITDRRLPLRLSSKPDFSEFVVPATAGMEKLFAPIREKAAKGNLVILRPNGQYLLLPAVPRENARPEALEAVERILSSTVARNVAVVTDTGWTMDAAPNLQRASQAIPFFGLLMGLSSIGHAVWIVDAPTDLAGACREADVLIVDSARAGALPAGWTQRARGVMRGTQVLIHDRATYRLLAVK